MGSSTAGGRREVLRWRPKTLSHALRNVELIGVVKCTVIGSWRLGSEVDPALGGTMLRSFDGGGDEKARSKNVRDNVMCRIAH